MKKILIAIIFGAFSFIQINAQEHFKLGVSGAIPTDNASRISTFSLAVDFAYILENSDIFQTGITTGFYQSFGEEVNGIDLDDTQFVPIAAVSRLNLSDVFTLGADLGYAIAIDEEDNNGGFYYAPKVVFNLSQVVALKVEYRGIIIPDSRTFDTIGFGIEFDL